MRLQADTCPICDYEFLRGEAFCPFCGVRKDAQVSIQAASPQVSTADLQAMSLPSQQSQQPIVVQPKGNFSAGLGVGAGQGIGCCCLAPFLIFLFFAFLVRIGAFTSTPEPQTPPSNTSLPAQ